ncbi:MAG: segregation/condensation protein A [Kiritimatiellae bacterium]|nr:segregation/condensation protein A [Kiritimatiellia bacterium]
MGQDALFAEDYKVNLEVFEGPLDLLLYLIRRDEVDIYDIPIERITKQYMEYLKLMRELSLDIAGEFIVMASTLMMIKSRMLLPVERRTTDDNASEDEWVDPRLDLVRQLIEYKKFKDAAIRLSAFELLRENAFGYGGEGPVFEKTDADAGLALGDIGLFDLLTAFKEVLARAPEFELGTLKGATWSVPDKMRMLVTRTSTEGHVSFLSLFTEETPRGEVIVTFLALLELLRMHRIQVQQTDSFQDITILPGDLAEASQPLNTDGVDSYGQ